MPKKCSVRSLSELSLAELAKTIVLTVGFPIQSNFNLTDTMIDINKYLNNNGATSDIYQDLLRAILASDYLEASIRFTCLQMLLNRIVQCLITEIFPFPYHAKILRVIAAQGRGLQVLNLKGIWIAEDDMNYMFDIIRKCSRLTHLCVPHIANDELLCIISQCSPNLRVLDVSGETYISEIGVEYLSKGVARSTLSIVDIGMLGEEIICHSDIAMLLEQCPNLESLGTYSFVGKSLKFIHDNVDENFKSKLKYLHDTKTDLNVLEIIVKTCPVLETIYLDYPNPGVLHKLKRSSLRRIKIYRFKCNELLDLLEAIGRNVVQLTMIKGRGGLELGYLASLCPCLIDLECYMMDKLLYTAKVKFNYIQGLEMLNSPMKLSTLKYFIYDLTSLKRLAIDTVAFTDEDILSIFGNHNFKFMEDIWFTSAPYLTIEAVETLMERCPELQSIGQLSGWALTPDDLALIRGLLKSGNSCLVLSPTTLFP